LLCKKRLLYSRGESKGSSRRRQTP
jgi:hypothetical protein